MFYFRHMPENRQVSRCGRIQAASTLSICQHSWILAVPRTSRIQSLSIPGCTGYKYKGRILKGRQEMQIHFNRRKHGGALLWKAQALNLSSNVGLPSSSGALLGPCCKCPNQRGYFWCSATIPQTNGSRHQDCRFDSPHGIFHFIPFLLAYTLCGI